MELEDVRKKKNSFVYLFKLGHMYNLLLFSGFFSFFFLLICFKYLAKTAGTSNLWHAGNFRQSGISVLGMGGIGCISPKRLKKVITENG